MTIAGRQRITQLRQEQVKMARN